MTFDRKRLFFAIFALSGFSGLIYESIWTHYLKLFLGHAAYAQTLVLAIFMGGMALGSWLSSRGSQRWRNLLCAYAVAEGVIGVLALAFHSVFELSLSFAFDTAIPAIGSPAGIILFKWLFAALLILPQSVLLGSTFPLMSAGIIRLFPDKPGRSIALLYFANSMGAAVGVLASGFLLVGLVGLPGTIRLAGVLNLALALAVWLLAREGRGEEPAALPHPGAKAPEPGFYRFMLLASLVTGAASFLYEIGWIRMLALVLGASTHAFELMLSAFILGLALGGLWIKRRIDAVADPVRLLGLVQLSMGLLALGTLLVYGNAFTLMELLLKGVERDQTGYLLFNFSSHAIALAVMLPATFCAGMTLPLVTFILLGRGYGERSIGAVYAANTVGAIVGIFLAVHAALPLLGVKGVITLGAALDLALGLALLRAGKGSLGAPRQRLALAVVLLALLGTVFLVRLDPYRMASGVYRDGLLLSPGSSRLVYHRDGKTATVSVSTQEGKMSIRTNGKVDGAIVMTEGQEANYDESTMILTGVIPMALHPGARKVANIGLGTGLTTHTVLGNPNIEQVDTVEIERCIVEGARLFGARNERVYTDPRSRIYLDDAKTFFSSYGKKYDLIISEPSNPWVSGVAGLFSEEFYRLAGRHLNREGLLVQWMQLYEIDPSLVASVLKAVSANFSDFVVYAPDDGDLLIIAKNGGRIGEPDPSVLALPKVAQALERIKVRTPQDLRMRRIGDKELMDRLARTFPIRANSDYYPVLDQNAARARFMRASGQEIISFIYDPFPVREMLTGREPVWPESLVTPTRHFPKSVMTARALALKGYLMTGSWEPRYGTLPDSMVRDAVLVRRLLLQGEQPGEEPALVATFNTFLNLSYLQPDELALLWRSFDWRGKGHLSEGLKGWLALYEAVARRDPQAMSAGSAAILSGVQPAPAMLKYAVSAGMLGAIASGDRSRALQLWTEYRPAMYGQATPDPLFRLLWAYAAEP